MPNPSQRTPRLALLIDADNTSARYLPTILNELPRHGLATIRRIYGDFTDPQAASWRQLLLDNSIMPIQQFSNVKNRKPGEKAGKNATDSALIIDAMDILYGGKVDGFVIVSSDSDFTRLAQRLRESNMIVVGMGRNQTSISFRHACTSFVNIEYLFKLDNDADAADEESVDDVSEKSETDIETTVQLADVEGVVAGIIRNNDNKGEVTELGEVGAGLHNKFPDFDVRSFGYTQLSKLIEDMDRFELEKDGSMCRVSIAARGVRDQVVEYIKDRLAESDSTNMKLAALAQEVYREFPNFRLKDAGYSQFGLFAESIPGVKVHGPKRQQVKLTQS